MLTRSWPGITCTNGSWTTGNHSVCSSCLFEKLVGRTVVLNTPISRAIGDRKRYSFVLGVGNPQSIALLSSRGRPIKRSEGRHPVPTFPGISRSRPFAKLPPWDASGNGSHGQPSSFVHRTINEEKYVVKSRGPEANKNKMA